MTTPTHLTILSTLERLEVANAHHVAHELVVALLTAKQRQVYDLLPNKTALIERRTGRDVYSTLLELREKGLAERKNGKWVRITETPCNTAQNNS